MIMLSISFCTYGSAENKAAGANSKKPSLRDQITLITSTSPVPSNPSTRIIKEGLESYLLIPELTDCPKIIICDAPRTNLSGYRVENYNKFLENLSDLCKSGNPAFQNTTIIKCKEFSCLAGALEIAVAQVKTPYMLIHQHDFQLLKTIDLRGLLKTMDRIPNIKHVRLNKKVNESNPYDLEVTPIAEKSDVPLCRCFGWSDNDHVTRKSYYTDFIFVHINAMAKSRNSPVKSYMEKYIHPMMRTDLKYNGDKVHPKYGTYLYGELGEEPYLFHLNGRGSLH